MNWTGDHRAFIVETYFKNKNFRYWSHNNPHEIQERPLHSRYVTVWCAISKFYIWGPYFFEDDNGTMTVTSERHCIMLNTFLRAKLNELEYRNNVWFQQDAAASHTSGCSIEIPRKCSRTIDFFVWCYWLARKIA